MTNICTICGFGPQNCECGIVPNYSDLNWTANQFSVPDSLIRQINNEHNSTFAQTANLTDTFANSVISERNVRSNSIWCAKSIQCDSQRLDDHTCDIRMNNFKTVKDFLEKSKHGQKKWEKLHEFWMSDIPAQVATKAQRGDWVQAQADLIGLTTDDSGRERSNYLRVTKANMVTRMLGDTDSLCLDSRRYRVLRPLLKRMLADNPTGHSPRGEYRVRGTKKDEIDYPAWDQRWLDGVLTRNPEEYRAVVTKVLDTLEEETRAPRENLGHYLFNLGGPTTYHDSVQELIDTR